MILDDLKHPDDLRRLQSTLATSTEAKNRGKRGVCRVVRRAAVQGSQREYLSLRRPSYASSYVDPRLNSPPITGSLPRRSPGSNAAQEVREPTLNIYFTLAVRIFLVCLLVPSPFYLSFSFNFTFVFFKLCFFLCTSLLLSFSYNLRLS